MSSTRFFVGAAVASLSLGWMLACAPAPGSLASDKRDAGNSGGAGGQADLDDPDLDSDAGADPDGACAAEGARATLTREPVDIVLVVDNSGSMGRQVESVQRHINARFAKVLEDHKLDYRVIVVSKHGDYKDLSLDHRPICIEAPLSGIPVGGCDDPPALPVDTARFHHYSYRIHPKRAVCSLLHGFGEPDQDGRAPNGWSAWLREGAFKSIVVLSPGRVECAFDGINYNDGNAPKPAEALATSFDEKLRNLAPEHFGLSSSERNYRFYSVTTVVANEQPEMPYPADSPLVTETCQAGDVNAGLGYQALSRLTGGTRFPFCNPDAFGAIFESIAKDVISGMPVDCAFPIPEPPPGESFDLSRTAVQYTPSNSDEPVLFGPVDDAAACVPKGFYIEDDVVQLCPETCALVQSDDAAKVSVLFDCPVIVR